MSKNNVVELSGRDTLADPLTELLRTGAERLIYQAVEAELRELLAEHAGRRTEKGKAGVVRDGSAGPTCLNSHARFDKWNRGTVKLPWAGAAV